MSARRKNPKDLEHELWRLYEHAAKDEWASKVRSPEWHTAAQTMALTAQAAMQAQAAQTQR